MTGIMKGIVVAIALVMCTLYLPGVAGAATLSCGDVITRDTVLTNDVGPCSGEGGLIGAGDNITLNLRRHRVFGTPEPGDGMGIHVVGSGVTVTNGTASHFDVGIAISGDRNRVYRMVARDNATNEESYFGDGISILAGADYNVVEDNLAMRNGPWDGISVGEIEETELSVGNIVRRNRVIDNTVPFTTGEQFADGILLLGFAQHTLVEDNFISRNGFAGMTLSGDDVKHNVIRGNQVVANGIPPISTESEDPAGIRIDASGPSNNLIERNSVKGNAVHGIVVLSGSMENRVLHNDVRGNNRLRLPDAFDLLDRNEGCDANVWRGNRFRTASPPCTRG